MSDPIGRRAKDTPAKLALRHNASDFSYAVLEGRIGAAASWLAGQRLKPRAVAAVCVFSTLDGWVIGMALRRLGLTTMAIAFPNELAAYGVSGVDVLVISGAEKLPGLEAASSIPLIRLPLEVLAGSAPMPAGERPRGGHILFTSGATGRPKSVLVDQTTLAAHLDQRAAAFGLTATTVCNVFDWGLWSSIGYLVPLKVWDLGGTVVLRQPADFGSAGLASQVTVAITTPVTLAQILARAPPPSRLDQMRLFVGGGPLPAQLAAEALARVSGKLATIAGSTEAGVWAVTPIASPEDVASHLPAPGRRIEVVDEAGAILPPGETGQIRINQLPGVNAYLGDPQGTRAAFHDGRFYPGDLGAIGADGRLQFRGRASDVVVRMNQKLAPEPLEALIASRLGAADACVFSADTGALSEELHVAIVARRTPLRSELEALSATDLAGFPRVHFHFVSELPRNDRGKLQRFLVKRQFLGA